MMLGEKKRNEWVIFLVAVLFLFIALITPAVSYSNPAGSINLYLSGAISFNIYGYGSVWLRATNPEIMVPSGFAICTLFISLITLSIMTSYLRKDIRNFKVLNLRISLLFNALALLISVIIWTIQFSRVLGVLPEEIIEMGYNNIWELFSPSFGLFGIFIAAGLIVAGIIYIQFNYEKKIGKLLSTKAERIKELNMIYHDILNELDHISNIAKERYTEVSESMGYLDMLNEKEMRKYNHLNRIANKINSVLFKSEKHDI